jgi:hypothetical protein
VASSITRVVSRNNPHADHNTSELVMWPKSSQKRVRALLLAGLASPKTGSDLTFCFERATGFEPETLTLAKFPT